MKFKSKKNCIKFKKNITSKIHRGMQTFLGNKKVNSVFGKMEASEGIYDLYSEEQPHKEEDIIEVRGINYRVLSLDDMTVEVARNKYASNDVFIPNRIIHRGMIFSIVRVGAYAFYGSQIESIVLPTSFYTIGESAFEGTWMLRCAILNGATTIGMCAFLGSGLECINMPEQPYTIEMAAFLLTPHLKSIDLNNATIFGYYLFENSGIETIVMPKNKYVVGKGMFIETENLNVIDMSRTILLPVEAFSNESNKIILVSEEVIPEIMSEVSSQKLKSILFIYPSLEKFKAFTEAINHHSDASVEQIRYDKVTYSDVDVKIGDSIRIGYSFIDSLDLKHIGFKWYKDGDELIGETSSLLIRDTAELWMSGDYELEVIVLKLGTVGKLGICTVCVK